MIDVHQNRSLRKRKIRQQCDSKKNSRDSTANIGDESKNLCVLLVRKFLSGQILHGEVAYTTNRQ